MTILQRLKREAIDGAKWRGHDMTRFKTTEKYLETSPKKIVCLSTCRVCGGYVQVDTRPAPNGIDIGGDAVALNCPIKNDGTD